MDRDLGSTREEALDALEAEHRVLKRVQQTLVDGLAPDVPASETISRLWLEGDETDIDPAPEIEAGEAVLARAGRLAGDGG